MFSHARILSHCGGVQILEPKKKTKQSTWDWKPNRLEPKLKNPNRPSPSSHYSLFLSQFQPLSVHPTVFRLSQIFSLPFVPIPPSLSSLPHPNLLLFVTYPFSPCLFMFSNFHTPNFLSSFFYPFWPPFFLLRISSVAELTYESMICSYPVYFIPASFIFLLEMHASHFYTITCIFCAFFLSLRR